jgi:hypothetical protein
MNTHELLISLCKDKYVLDLGFVQHNIKNHDEKDWLYKNLKNVSKSIHGLGFLEKEINYFKSKGYDCSFGNVENFSLNKKYEVIVEGELIDHLSNFDGFLTCCRKQLSEDGIMILTTPNVFAFGNILTIFNKIFGKQPSINKEPTCWFDETTLELLFKRFNFKTIEINTFPSPLKKIMNRFLSKILKFYPSSKIVGKFSL